MCFVGAFYLTTFLIVFSYCVVFLYHVAMQANYGGYDQAYSGYATGSQGSVPAAVADAAQSLPAESQQKLANIVAKVRPLHLITSPVATSTCIGQSMFQAKQCCCFASCQACSGPAWEPAMQCSLNLQEVCCVNACHHVYSLHFICSRMYSTLQPFTQCLSRSVHFVLPSSTSVH